MNHQAVSDLGIAVTGKNEIALIAMEILRAVCDFTVFILFWRTSVFDKASPEPGSQNNPQACSKHTKHGMIFKERDVAPEGFRPTRLPGLAA